MLFPDHYKEKTTNIATINSSRRIRIEQKKQFFFSNVMKKRLDIILNLANKNKTMQKLTVGKKIEHSSDHSIFMRELFKQVS